jgi:hypothetical protein
MGFITGDDLSVNYEYINRAYNLDAMKPYWFRTQNSNAAGSFAAEQGGFNIDWSRTPYKLYGLNYDNRTEVDDPNGHTFNYDDGYGNSGVVKTAFDGKLISDEYSSVNRTRETVRPDASGGYTLEQELNGVLKLQAEVHAAGDALVKSYDTANARLWDERVTGMDPTGNVTAVQVKLNGESQTRSAANPVDFSVIGQIFGSAIGRAIVGKNGNPFVTLTGETVAGFVGQKFVQALIDGPGAIDLAQVDLADVFFGKGVSLAGAGLGAASSFLTAELATSIGLTGVGAQMFNAAVGGYLGSVLNQVRAQGFNVLTAVVDWNVALHASEVNIASAFGSFLAHQFVHAESQFGAVGGQLAGAIGGALAYSFSVGLGSVLNVFLPGVGAFFGTIIGTIIGDAIAGDPQYPKAFHDIEIIGSDPTHFQNRLVGTDDHGNAEVSEAMGDQVTKIANGYLDAVHGAAIYYSGKVMIGYNAGAAPYQYITGWFPDGINGPSAHFATATDAIQEGVRELLVNTEVFGGDLLVKRAHQAFINGHHAAPTEIAPDFTDLASLGGDIRTAQDYEQYLNDRETINALIELYPNSAFTAGWAATFARVHELKLDQVRGSDFIGGVVGWLDSVNKAGLGAEAANATVKLNGTTVTVEIKIANGAEVPGALSVFADTISQTSDATGTTVRFVFNNGLAVTGFQFAGASGTGDNDILTGSAGDDTIHGGAGWDFIDGGTGFDTLYGEDGNDILRGGKGNDNLQGGQGDDTYVFNRGDGADTVLDEYSDTVFVPDPTGPPGSGRYETRQLDAGTDSLVFGPGVAVSDVLVQASPDNRDLIVGVRDPAHPGVAFEQLTDKITLKNWINDQLDRIEFLRFADGTTLKIGAAVGSYLVPFGASLSHSSLVEKSAAGTVVGTVVGYDLQSGASLSYSIAGDPSGAFAVNAATGAITTTVPLNYEYNAAHSLQIAVRVSDGAHFFDQPFTINLIDIPNRAPLLSVPASTIKADPGQTLQVSSWFSASDADNDALTYYFQDSSPAANSGHFVLNGTPVAANISFSVNAAQLATLTFVAGAEGVVDELGMQLSDGHAVSAGAALHINVNRAPVLNVPAANITANHGQTLQVSSWFSATDADNDALTYYFLDGTTASNSGYFALNGTPYAQGAAFGVSAAQLAQLTFVAGASGVTDDLGMQLSDGHAVSAGAALHVNVNVNRAPVLTVPAGNITTNPGQTLQVSSLFSAADADNDALTYYFLDVTTAANSGYFALNGTPYAQGATFGVSAAQLAHLTFVAGAAGVTDDFGMQLSDGTAVSAGAAIHVNAKAPTPTDFNGDGKSDLLLLNDTTHGLYVCEMNGAVMGDNALSFTIAAGAGWHYQGLGDFDGDRKSDVLLLNYTTDGVYVCLMNGTALGTNAQAFRIDSPNGWHFQTLGDFNGDGKSDVLLMNSVTNGVYVCEMNGTQLATNGLSFNVQAADGWRFQDLGDFNGDGKSDILLSNDVTHGLCVCEMDGTELGAHALSFNVAAGAGWHFQDLADFNGDGKTDILLINDLTHGVYVCEMNGTQLAANGQAGTVADGWHFADTGDFNGDGKADLLFVNDTTHGVTVWQMNGTQVEATAQVGTMLAGSHYLGQGDYNGDSKTDLVFQNDATRDEQLWQMNGTSILDNSHIVTLAAGWHMVI